MLTIREKYYYTKSHEWVFLETGNIVVCGISEIAQSDFGEIVFIELPSIDKFVTSGDIICTIESVKTISDIYSPLSGKIVDINKSLINYPSLINNFCYDKGWLFKIKISSLQSLNNLMSSTEYKKNFN